MELHLGTAPMSDDAVLQGFEACQLDPAKFHHADHIRLAWLCVQRYGASGAEVKLLDGIRKFAERAGAPRKFHYTITIAWTRLVAAARQNGSTANNFSEWVESHPELLDRNLLANYYSPARLQTEEARSGWVGPDLAPLGKQ
ncbi:MAG TPA: hypothetical protein VNU20_06780 [Candidatus Sulfotelmatobacter sp.]|jgi:hypothetical protein|nr:hypothetical protein [Candidatus Sulfotelmatobacter sp.]